MGKEMTMIKKTYTFFYHYFKAKKKMSIHWRGSCHVVNDIICKVPCETKWRKRAPFLVMYGKAKSMELDGETAIIS